MIKRALLGMTLGAALIGGAAVTFHGSGHASVYAAAVHSDLTVTGTGPETADTDANIPCTNAGTATETGDCNSGPADATNDTGTEPAAGAEAGDTGPDGDNVQSGP